MHATHNPPTPAPAGLTPATVLRAAANYLTQHGWHQGGLYAHTGTDTGTSLTPPACAMGAMRVAACGEPIHEFTEHLYPTTVLTLVDQALDVLAARLGMAPRDEAAALDAIGAWNDSPYTTITEVVTAMRAAANDWDRTHGGAQ